MAKLSDALRRAVAAKKLSANELSKRIGMQQVTLSRFLRGYHISTLNADRIARYLHLELAAKKRKKRKG